MTEIELIKKELNDLKLGPCDLNPHGMSADKFNFYANVNLRFNYLITTIESQNSQIESLKAITELAVKGLKEIACLNVDSAYSAGTIARNTFSEIERLQNDLMG